MLLYCTLALAIFFPIQALSGTVLFNILLGRFDSYHKWNIFAIAFGRFSLFFLHRTSSVCLCSIYLNTFSYTHSIEQTKLCAIFFSFKFECVRCAKLFQNNELFIFISQPVLSVDTMNDLVLFRFFLSLSHTHALSCFFA